MAENDMNGDTGPFYTWLAPADVRIGYNTRIHSFAPFNPMLDNY